jgi:hypothetical protein
VQSAKVRILNLFNPMGSFVMAPYQKKSIIYISVSQPPGRGLVPGPGINYTGPREVNILQWKYSEENNIRECVEKLRPRTPK